MTKPKPSCGNGKLLWHDEPCFSFDYATTQWFIGKAATQNRWHLKYVWYLFCLDKCIAAFKTLDHAKKVAELITKG